MSKERCLYVIPIIHTPADMGHLQDQVSISEENEAAITKYWLEVGRYVRDTFITGGIKIDKVYQDGLPDVAEEDVTRAVAQAQTANYEILRWLKSRDILIRGTENPALLLKEERNFEILLHPSQDEETWVEAKIAYAQVLGERDDYIGQRIQQDLLPGETGVLFIGAMRDVNRLRNTMHVLESKNLKAKFPKIY